jgi:formylglycine-generating enzyme required for sulfatase activity
VPIHEIGTLPDGRPYFTMKEVRGRTLSDWLADDQPPPLRRAIEALHRAAEAVAYAHARGVVHRDLKPENLMVGAFGEVLVLDWGIAGAVGEAQPTGGPLSGTPGFVAPEVRSGAPLTTAADVWALGRVLELLLAKIAPPDDELHRVVAEATADDPAGRLPHAGAFVERLEAWLEGSRRRARARELVERARGRVDEIATLREAARSLRDGAREALDALPAWAPLDDKRPLWATLDRAEELARDAALAEAERDRDLHAALREAPGDPDARDLLADGWVDRYADALARRDQPGAARYEALLRADGGERHRRWLRGGGAVSLTTDVPARVTAWPFVERDRRYGLGDPVELGSTPLRSVELPHGSWLLVVHGPAGEVRVPVLVERLGHWDAVEPEGRPHVLRLPRPGELGPDDVLVPGGWTRVGGDPLAYGPLPARRLWVDPFVIGRHPVLERDYLAFVRSGVDPELAPKNEPALGGFLWPRGTDGAFALDGRDPRLPVHGVDWLGASAYAAWVAASTGLPWRLPTDVEWEKAARGVDGRTLPFGDHCDALFCCIAGSHQGAPAVQRVDSFPLDESPYGVRGLAGNVRDWVADRYARNGAPAVGGRQPPLLDPDPDATRIQRGGAWSFHEQHARAATRWWQDPRFRHTAAGFRLARSW